MKKRLRIAAKILAGIVAVGLVGDLIYSLVVANQIQSWEESIQRDADGVWHGCGAYKLEPTPDTPDRGALLLVHGINASPRHFDKMAPALAERGFACQAMRLPGFAEPVPRYAATRSKDWIAAVDEQLRVLRSQYDRVGVVAHSLGGATVIGQLLNSPESADYAVLLAPATAVSNSRSPFLSTRTWHKLAGRTVFFTRTLRSPFGMDCHDTTQLDHPGRTPFTPRVVVDELFQLMDDNWRQVEDFRTPMLMVLSRHDRVIDSESAERFYEECSSPQKSLHYLDNSGHAIPLDFGWEETVEQIDTFSARF